MARVEKNWETALVFVFETSMEQGDYNWASRQWFLTFFISRLICKSTLTVPFPSNSLSVLWSFETILCAMISFLLWVMEHEFVNSYTSHFPCLNNMLNIGRSDRHKQAYLTQLCDAARVVWAALVCFLFLVFLPQFPQAPPSIEVPTGTDATPFSNSTSSPTPTFTPAYTMPRASSKHRRTPQNHLPWAVSFKQQPPFTWVQVPLWQKGPIQVTSSCMTLTPLLLPVRPAVFLVFSSTCPLSFVKSHHLLIHKLSKILH